MEVINRLEFLTGSIGVVIGFFFGLFLIFKKKGFSKANIFLAIYLLVFSVRMGKSMFYEHLTVHRIVHQLFLSSLLLIGPSLWFYFSLLTKRNINVQNYRTHYSVFILVSSISLFIDLSYEVYFYLGLFSHGLLYSFFVFYCVVKDKYLKENNVFKKWLLLLTIVTITMFLNSILIFFNVVPFYPTSAFLFSISILLLFIYGVNNLSLFETEKVKYATSSLSEKEANEYYEKLRKLIEKDRLYLDSELSLTKLSKLIGISSKELSQVINQIKSINYSQYIMSYRVEEAKRKLKNPKYNAYKISAIAYESGFNSISSFNNAFKKIANTTAVKYRSS